MRIDINKKYFIDSNQYEYTVCENSEVKSGAKAGDILDKAIAHYSSLDGAIKFLVERTIKTSKTINDLKQLNEEVKQIKKDIEKALEPLTNVNANN